MKGCNFPHTVWMNECLHEIDYNYSCMTHSSLLWKEHSHGNNNNDNNKLLMHNNFYIIVERAFPSLWQL